jgi:hypothetical protein
MSWRPSSRWLSIITPVMRARRRPSGGHVGGHVDLALVLLAAVGVRDIDHHLLAQAGGLQQAQAASTSARCSWAPCRRAG